MGLPASIAWLWPCAIDLAIAQATLCLLSLSRQAIVVAVTDDAAGAVPVPQTSHRLPSQPVPVTSERQRRPPQPAERNGLTARARIEQSAESGSAMVGSVDSADIERWQPVAESIVRDGVTSKHPRLVATILAQREAGVPPSTIGRHHKVHHSTVGRILSAAQTSTE